MIDYEDIDCIDHHGIVTAVDAAAGTVTVIINARPSCSPRSSRVWCSWP